MGTAKKSTSVPTRRVRNPLTQQAGEQQYAKLAEKTGITRSHVCRIMNGNREPSLGVAVKLAKALKMTMDEFVKAMAKVNKGLSTLNMKQVKVVRSSASGKFVQKTEAKRNPATTQTETVRR